MGTEEDNKNAISQEHGEASTNAATAPAVVPNQELEEKKISERMKFLQELVPGCNKVTGKAVMLDEIINYVQSLQRQVEFLSMKLATVNPLLDLNNEGLLAKDILMAQGGPSAMGFSPDMSMVHAQQALLQGIPNMGNSLDTLRRTISSQLGLMGSGYKDLPQTIEILEELVEAGSETMDVCNKEQVVTRMKAAVASKQFGQEDILCPLIADAHGLKDQFKV